MNKVFLEQGLSDGKEISNEPLVISGAHLTDGVETPLLTNLASQGGYGTTVGCRLGIIQETITLIAEAKEAHKPLMQIRDILVAHWHVTVELFSQMADEILRWGAALNNRAFISWEDLAADFLSIETYTEMIQTKYSRSSEQKRGVYGGRWNYGYSGD